jgi:hypothetical protein
MDPVRLIGPLISKSDIIPHFISVAESVVRGHECRCLAEQGVRKAAADDELESLRGEHII